MNLNELSQKLEDHLTDQDIQEAQALLDSTCQEVVDMRGELVEAQAELSALRTAAIADAAEIERLKAQNAELLAAQQWRPIESAPKDGTDFLVDCDGVTIARWQPNGSQHPWIFLDTDDGKFIFNRFRESVEGLVWRHKPLGWEAIAKTRGDL